MESIHGKRVMIVGGAGVTVSIAEFGIDWTPKSASEIISDIEEMMVIATRPVTFELTSHDDMRHLLMPMAHEPVPPRSTRWEDNPLCHREQRRAANPRKGKRR